MTGGQHLTANLQRIRNSSFTHLIHGFSQSPCQRSGAGTLPEAGVLAGLSFPERSTAVTV
jgi:hypothetical protein